MFNSSVSELPPLPSYTLTPRQPLISPIPDNATILILPIVAYWALSMAFHWIDVNDYFPQYRLHTPAEILKRNHVSRWEVVRDVIIQQVIQTLFGVLLIFFDQPEFNGREEYDVAVWATRIRIAQRAIPQLMSLIGVDPVGLAAKLSTYPVLAAVVSGGHYPFLTQMITLPSGETATAPAFAAWELAVGHAIYFYLIPVLQFLYAITFVDTWQYFLHRAMHMNKWLYSMLYVPYAFGALYNHPFEGFLLDTAGTGLAFLTCGMTTRQGMWFFTCSTLKTVDDHCGYAFPWDPLQHVTANNAAYHDIHHQSWGIKTNFSQPFFTFWDALLNTRWQGDVTQRYERSRIAAQNMVDQDLANNSPDNDSQQQPQQQETVVVASRVDDDASTRSLLKRSVRKTTNSFSPQSDSLKGLTHRLSGSIQHK
ncbi:sphingolipid C4-hydroxylase SUR2 [Microsporum canis CBS 113480]|uniref:Sphingolipid C4-hydroxylase SUR2 n=1 Tax=Arthroderma otae (strain ATCC MYA-4605 / CBS 113480) TaxID=554155 RepID=C5G1B2_ARTOC|nr:sphingolipid C4-hydroxylase SUR2 [Microsporum canis CBS 113480]EEQ28575.1 sphingolipid C4-hydroxylase SUR2 [Microsporum canis CBS 113480]